MPRHPVTVKTFPATAVTLTRRTEPLCHTALGKSCSVNEADTWDVAVLESNMHAVMMELCCPGFDGTWPRIEPFDRGGAMAARQPLTVTGAADAGSANAIRSAPTIARTATMETRTFADRIGWFAPRLVMPMNTVPPEPEARAPSSQAVF
jgi:hypothetical protein